MNRFFDDPVMDKFYQTHAPEFRTVMRQLHGHPVDESVINSASTARNDTHNVLMLVAKNAAEHASLE